MTSIVVGKDRITLLESERYIAGTKKGYKIKVLFSKDWDRLDKKLVFKTDDLEIVVDLLESSECFPIPSEVFNCPTTKLQVGAFGYNDKQKILNTRWTSLGRVSEGVLDNDCDYDCDCKPILSVPSLNAYSYLEGLINKKGDRLTFENGMLILWSGNEQLSSCQVSITPSDGSKTDHVAVRVPLGTIQIWSGTLDNIPESYSLCDGQNGTPDLRYAMIVGASDELEPGTVIGDAMKSMSPLSPSPNVHYYVLAFIQKTSLTEADMKEGKTAYDLAVEQGFEGTLEEYLQSLHGKSAYEIAVENGYAGSIEDFTNHVSVLPNLIVKDLTIHSKDELPMQKTGAYILEDVWIRSSIARTNAIHFVNDFVYVNLLDPSKIILTDLENHQYECSLDEMGQISSIEEVEISSGGTSEKGPKGDPGLSAYEIAVENGFEGNELEWLLSLNGDPGKDGKSAYDIALDNGFEGSESEWLDSLKGPKGDPGTGDSTAVEGPPGKSAYQIAVENGFSGSESEWLDSLKGPKGDPGLPAQDGLSAYQVAQMNGFMGDELDWLDSLKGPPGQKGSNGKSAYQIAQENGFSGTEKEWLDSLKGEKGENGKSVQRLEIYSETPTVVGKWIDDRPVYRITRVVEVNLASTLALVEGLDGADLIKMNIIMKCSKYGSTSSYLIPCTNVDGNFYLQFDDALGTLYLRTDSVDTSEYTFTIILEYVVEGDPTLTDDDLVTSPEASTGGTNDHTQLVNRSAMNQHPISSIGGLADKLNATPSKVITDEELNALFNNT